MVLLGPPSQGVDGGIGTGVLLFLLFLAIPLEATTFGGGVSDTYL